MKIPDAEAVYLPRPSVARLKIQAHITLVQSPTRTSSRAQIGTTTILKELPVNTGIETVVSLPRSMAITISSIAIEVAHIIRVRLETLSAMNPALNLPTSIKNQ